MGTINFTAYEYKYMKKQVTLLKQDKGGTELEVDLKRTENYCLKLLALYLRRMII